VVPTVAVAAETACTQVTSRRTDVSVSTHSGHRAH